MTYKLAKAGIIDDDKVYQLVMRKTIEQTGLVKSILQFYDGEEAISYFKEQYSDSDALPALILLDINMPYMDGWQFLDEFIKLDFKTDYRSTIFIVSSSSNFEDINKAKLYSVVSGYHIKPISRFKFEEMIGSIINTA